MFFPKMETINRDEKDKYKDIYFTQGQAKQKENGRMQHF